MNIKIFKNKIDNIDHPMAYCLSTSSIQSVKQIKCNVQEMIVSSLNISKRLSRRVIWAFESETYIITNKFNKLTPTNQQIGNSAKVTENAKYINTARRNINISLNILYCLFLILTLKYTAPHIYQNLGYFNLSSSYNITQIITVGRTIIHNTSE